MSPFFASLLTAAFILFLFYRDAGSAGDRSSALWLPVLWMTITGSRFVSQWLDLGSYDASSSAGDGSPIDAMYFGTLILAAVVVLKRRGVSFGRVAGLNKCLVVFVLYGLVSVVWSDLPFMAAKRWIKTLGHPLMALVILTDPDPLLAVRTVLKRCAFTLLPVSVLFIKYYPEYGRGFDNWTGEATNNGVGLSKNDLGYVCMALGLFFVWNLLSTRRGPGERRDRAEAMLSIGFLAIIGWLLATCDSATSLATLVTGSLVLCLLASGLIDRRLVGTYLIVTLVVVAIAQSTFDIYSTTIEMLGRNPTLTDRTAIWADALALQSRPLTGFGFESFWTGDRLDVLWRKWWWHPNQAHNGYIETYLNLGAIGLALLALALLATLRSINRSVASDDPFARLRLAFFLAILAFNYTEAAFKGVHFIWTIFYLVALDVPQVMPRRARTRQSTLRMAAP